MNWKKSFFIISLTAILLLSLSACGGEPAPVADSPAENKPANDQSASTADLPADEEPAAPQEEPTTEPQSAPTEESQPEEPTAQISYSADVQPILESRCYNCHGGERIEGNFVMITYADLLAGGESGAVVIPGDTSASYLVELILDQKMPKRGPKLTPIQMDTIITWIDQGADNN